jgi:hypothetical protein
MKPGNDARSHDPSRTQFGQKQATHENKKCFHEIFAYCQIHPEFRINKEKKLEIFLFPSRRREEYSPNFFLGGETLAGSYSSIRVQPGMKLFRASQRNRN